MVVLRFILFLWVAAVMGVLLMVILAVTIPSLRRYMEDEDDAATGEVFLICCVVSFAVLILVAW